ncbi:MAG: class I SAM-dependent methyltransferase [Solirubrobacterales bacterium]
MVGYDNESFDLVFHASVFPHLLPDAAWNYVRKTARVLRPGDTCFATFRAAPASRRSSCSTRPAAGSGRTGAPVRLPRSPTGVLGAHRGLPGGPLWPFRSTPCWRCSRSRGWRPRSMAARGPGLTRG